MTILTQALAETFSASAPSGAFPVMTTTGSSGQRALACIW